MKRIPLLATAIAVLAAGGLLAVLATARGRTEDGAGRPLRFALIDQNGHPFTQANADGRILLLYFGYTFCPDVCPTELGYLARVLRALGPEAARTLPVLVTIDPQRDTVAKLAAYVPLYHERLVGLTGDTAAIAALAAQLDVHYQRADVVSGKPGYYLMDHTATTFVIGRDGRLAAKLDSHTTPVADAAAIIRRLL